MKRKETFYKKKINKSEDSKTNSNNRKGEPTMPLKSSSLTSQYTQNHKNRAKDCADKLVKDSKLKNRTKN